MFFRICICKHSTTNRPTTLDNIASKLGVLISEPWYIIFFPSKIYVCHRYVFPYLWIYKEVHADRKKKRKKKKNNCNVSKKCIIGNSRGVVLVTSKSLWRFMSTPLITHALCLTLLDCYTKKKQYYFLLKTI